MDSPEKLTLKFGGIKHYKLVINSPAWVLSQRFINEDLSDEEEQKLTLEFIDLIDCPEIYLSWKGIYVSKEEAKKYVLEYGQREAS